MPERAGQFFEERRQRGLQLKVITYNFLISACGKSSLPGGPCSSSRSGGKTDSSPNRITYSTPKKLCGDDSVPETALQLSDTIRQDEPLSNVITKGWMAEWALQVFEEMVQQGFQPDVIAYTDDQYMREGLEG